MCRKIYNLLFHHIIRFFIEKKFRKIYSLGGGQTKITLISQNCIGGVIYHTLGLPFNSPTINMFIEGENFVKLLEHLEYYMGLVPIAVNDSYKDPVVTGLQYPLIKIGDVELCCLHYKNCVSAIDAWERRKKRIDYDNVYVLANTWDLDENEELINRLYKTGFKTIVLTTNKKFKYDSKMVYINGDFTLDEKGNPVPSPINYIDKNAYRYFEKYFDFIGWLTE